MRSVCLCVGNNTGAAATLVSTQTDAPLFLHTVALKTQFIRSYKEVFSSAAQTPSVTELYYLYRSLTVSVP